MKINVLAHACSEEMAVVKIYISLIIKNEI